MKAAAAAGSVGGSSPPTKRVRGVAGAAPPLPSTGKGGGPLLVAAATPQEYQGATRAVGSGEKVLELGCALSDITKALVERVGPAGWVVGGDTPRKTHRSVGCKSHFRSGETLAGVKHFVEIESPYDCLAPPLRDELGAGPTCAFLDLGIMTGNDLLLDTLALVRQLQRVYHETLRLVVVKSPALCAHAGSYASSAQLCQNKMARQAWEVDIERRPGLRVLGAIEVAQYREAIPLVVRPGDKALEIGCHLGTTTRLLHDAVRAGPGGLAIGVDVGTGNIKSARKAHKDIRFEVADGYDVGGLRALGVDFDVIFVDIGGLSGAEGLLEAVALLRQLGSAFPSCRALVIKSKCVQRHARTMLVGRALLTHLDAMESQSQAGEPAPPGLGGE